MMDSGEYDEYDYGVVIDVYQLLPKDYVTHISEKDCNIYYFLSSNTTPEERFNILKKHDTPGDYTYYHSRGNLISRSKCITNYVTINSENKNLQENKQSTIWIIMLMRRIINY